MGKFIQQFRAVAYKNAVLKLRGWKVLFFEFLIPVIVIYAMNQLRLALNPSLISESLPSKMYGTNSLSNMMNGTYTWDICYGENLFWYCANDVGNTNPCAYIDANNNNTVTYSPQIGGCKRNFIAIAPDTLDNTNAQATVTGFMDWAKDTFPSNEYETMFNTFDSEAAFNSHIQSPAYSIDSSLTTYSGAIIFTSGAPNWAYTVRLNTTTYHVGSRERMVRTSEPNLDLTVKYATQWPPSQDYRQRPYAESYRKAGFFALTDAVNSYIATDTCRTYGSCSNSENVTLNMAGNVDFPNPEVWEEGFWAQLGNLFALLVTIAMLYPLSNGVKELVSEKESKMRQIMMIMSLRTDVLVLTWALHFLCLFIPLAWVLAAVGSSLFSNSDFTYIYRYFFWFFVSSMSYFGLISVFFSQPKTASVIGSMSFFLGYLLYIGIENADIGRVGQLLCCLHPATAFTYGTLAFQEWEDVQIGITDDTHDTSNKYDITFNDVIVMMIVDTVYLNILTWYIGHIWEGEYGTSKSWTFPFTSCYSCFKNCFQYFNKNIAGNNVDEVEIRNLREVELSTLIQRNSLETRDDTIETVPIALLEQVRTGDCVSIRSLHKTFNTATGPKHAVRDVNLEMFSGQVTTLLGHNGAGKSTTIAMLTGLTSPDLGGATIAGYDLRTEIDKIRECIGICPQHDVLFPELTVEEHLRLFASIKGVPSTIARNSVNNAVLNVGLTEKRYARSRMLSGGQKRKLSLAIAFLGDSKVVFLDEPTSGMDPYSRRFTWNIIRQQKAGRVIVLTTHFMDEADLLGDRIAIMGDGYLKCCGSSLFLKKRFGAGYTISMDKKNPINFDVNPILNNMRRFVTGTKLLTDVGSEVSVQLPYDSVKSFAKLFKNLDSNLSELGILSYGISVTTMEEVFLKVAEDVGAREHDSTISGDKGNSDVIGEDSTDVKQIELQEAGKSSDRATDNTNVEIGVTGDLEIVSFSKIPAEEEWLIFRRHISTMLWKRYLFFSRDRKAWVLQFLLPVIFLLIGIIVMIFAPFYTYQPAKVVTLDMYNKGVTTNSMPSPYSAASSFCNNNLTVSDFTCSSFSTTLGQSVIMANMSDVDNLPVEPQSTATNFYNMSTMLLANRTQYLASRYGAVSFLELNYSNTIVPGSNANGLPGVLSNLKYAIHANYTGAHAAPLYTTLVADATIRMLANNMTYSVSGVSPVDTPSIELTIHPMPKTEREKVFLNAFSASLLVSFIMLSIPYIPAAFGLFVVREREIKAKYQQIVSGVSMAAYWLSTWMFDNISYLFTAFLIVSLISCFEESQPITGAEAIPAVILLFLFFGTSVSGFAYCLSYLYNNAPGAQIGIIFIVMITGLALSILGVFFRIFDETRGLYLDVLRPLLCILPPFAFGDGMQAIALRKFFAAVENTGLVEYSVWDWQVAGIDITFLAWTSVVYLSLAVAIDYYTSFSSTKRKPKMPLANTSSESANNTTTAPEGDLESPTAATPIINPDITPDMLLANADKDTDVITEEARVHCGEAVSASDKVILDTVSKTYPGGKRAVRGMSMGIPAGECFGLLGINGAGKSSTIAMLTGEVSPSTGDCYLEGHSISTDVHNCRRKVGFCPQFDALFDFLTGREHLELYARVKGVYEEDIPAVVEAKIREMGLLENADRGAWSYSGGNKRKLSVAIAMIGEPEIVFLDEPSTGMDPVTRRYMWKVITDIVTKRERCSMILTTHSMEEAEALCTRIGIMVGGVLRCLGSTQRLRSLYGLGYQLEVGLSHPVPKEINKHVNRLIQNLANNFDNSDDSQNESKNSASSNKSNSKATPPVGTDINTSESKSETFLNGRILTPTEIELVLQHSLKGDQHNIYYQMLHETHDADEVDIGDNVASLPSSTAPTTIYPQTLMPPAFARSHAGCSITQLASWLLIEERVSTLYSFLQKEFPGYILRERQELKVRIEISGQQGRINLQLASLFDLMEQHRISLNIEDYSISQTSLEQIFNSFAQQQREETGHVSGMVR